MEDNINNNNLLYENNKKIMKLNNYKNENLNDGYFNFDVSNENDMIFIYLGKLHILILFLTKLIQNLQKIK